MRWWHSWTVVLNMMMIVMIVKKKIAVVVIEMRMKVGAEDSKGCISCLAPGKSGPPRPGPATAEVADCSWEEEAAVKSELLVASDGRTDSLLGGRSRSQRCRFDYLAFANNNHKRR